MTDSLKSELARLEARYERERKVRTEAEAIAETATRRLYELTSDLERARAEMEQMYLAQRDFIAIASHELQTPIAPIAGFATTLLERWEQISEDDKREFVRAIDRQAQRLSRLTTLLLTVSRLEGRRLRAHPEPLDVGRCIDQVLAQLGDDGRDVSMSCPPGLRAVVDPDHILQILCNYVSNAVRHGAPPVTIEARDGGNWVEIRVEDSGEGVPPQFVPRLFEKFAQADVSTSPVGTGLGLFIVRGLARAQSGEAWYEPRQPRGACFAVRLPRAT